MERTFTEKFELWFMNKFMALGTNLSINFFPPFHQNYTITTATNKIHFPRGGPLST